MKTIIELVNKRNLKFMCSKKTLKKITNNKIIACKVMRFYIIVYFFLISSWS